MDIETSPTIYSTGSNGTHNGCLFDSNYASRGKSKSNCKPIINIDGYYLFEECQFNNNQVLGYEHSYCGCLFISGSKYSIMKCTFYKNKAESYDNRYYQNEF